MDLNESGQLSLDFLVGFTIFLVGFIFVITMVSGLLIGLQSKTIDYDAVAYRTGVILVEDPGYALDRVFLNDITYWESIPPEYSDQDVLRIGLAITKLYPGVLSDGKMMRFDEISSENIHRTVLFDTPVFMGGPAQYPYNYNIRFRYIDPPGTQWEHPSSDTIPPDRDPGYIRRAVKVKPPSEAVIDKVLLDDTVENIIVYLDFPFIYDRGNPVYYINPLGEKITITLTNIIPDDLEEVSFWRDYPPLLSDPNDLSGDTVLSTTVRADQDVEFFQNGDSVTLIVNPRFFTSKSVDPGNCYYFKFYFNPGQGGGLFRYHDAMHPFSGLQPAILEVHTW